VIPTDYPWAVAVVVFGVLGWFLWGRAVGNAITDWWRKRR
jgi:hypothetical protein